MHRKIITLLTDFGLADSYVGVMKGVMLQINPKLTFIDITHSIQQGDIKRASFQLFTAYRYFPSSTIHLIVVDPGVGTKRNPIIVKTKDYYFVGPDNGIFSWIYAKEKFKVYKINCRGLLQYAPTAGNGRRAISNTFHGRDIFAPIAAKLSLGEEPAELGKQINKWVALKLPNPTFTQNRIIGEVIDIDQFGNLITNISKSDFWWSRDFEIRIKGYAIHELKTSYEGKTPPVKTGPIAIFGSSDLLEIALPRGNCASLLNAKISTKLTIQKL